LNINSKLIAEIVIGISGVIGLGVLCKKTSQSKSAETTVSDNSSNDEPISFADSFVSENSAQAETDFVNAINTIRLNELFAKLAEIDYRENNVQEEIAELKKEIEQIISSNRGGQTGMHGFIGESCQVHIANVKSFLQGKKALHVLLDDNSMTDYTRGSQLIQQKACQSDNHLGLDHVKRHFEKYPEFIDQGGIYQIPKDFYQKFDMMRNTPPEVAAKFRKEDLRLWKVIHEFSEANPDIVIEPMEVSYRDIQAGNVNNTVSNVEKSTDEEFKKQKADAQSKYSPSAKELIKVSSISGLFEGTLNAALSAGMILKSGKKLKDFDKSDKMYIFKQFAIGFLRGSIRACITYLLTAFCKVSSTLASTLTTALFALVKHTYTFIKKGKSKADYIKELLIDLAEIALTALGAYIGKSIFKKNPIVGSILGSITFSTGCKFARKYAYA
jgi:hypothetical protein